MSRRVMVTGAAGGLGLAIASQFSARGDDVWLVDLHESVHQSASDTPSPSRAWQADLNRESDVAEVVEAIAAEGGLDVLVNNAGITRDARLEKMSVEDFAAVVDTNLVSPMKLTLALEPHLSDGAAVVNISSRAALGNFGQTNYVVSKAGLIGFTRALALEWAPRIRVNAVAPGLVDSGMTRAMPKDLLHRLVDRVPLARIGTPDDIANAVAFLCSPEAGYITGQTLLVCGGRSVAR